MPLWLSPEQVRIMTITDRADDAAYTLKAKLETAGISAEVDARNEKIGFKLREARHDKLPYMVVIGDKEAENGTAAVTKRGTQESIVMTAEDFISQVLGEIDSKDRSF